MSQTFAAFAVHQAQIELVAAGAFVGEGATLEQRGENEELEGKNLLGRNEMEKCLRGEYVKLDASQLRVQ